MMREERSHQIAHASIHDVRAARAAEGHGRAAVAVAFLFKFVFYCLLFFILFSLKMGCQLPFAGEALLPCMLAMPELPC